MSTTRLEIAQHGQTAFRTGQPVTREQLIAAAERDDAPPGVIDQVRQLPNRPFGSIRDLWPALPGLPVEA